MTDAQARLSALLRTGLLDSPPEEPFDRWTRLARRILKTPVALVSLVDADRQFFKSQQGLPAQLASSRETPLSHSFCKHVVERQQPLVVEDAHTHPLVRDNPAVRELNVAAYLGAPLATPDGHVLGSLCVIDMQPRQWSEEDLATIRDLADAVTGEIALRGEIARRQASEEQAELLNRELAHRIKNIFTVSQSLIALSLRDSPAAQPFARDLTYRLAALSKAHEFVTPLRQAGDGGEQTLRSLIDLLLEAYPKQQVEVHACDQHVGLRAASALALIIHELATNSVKYGAFSVPNGAVRIDCRVHNGDVQMNWRETGGRATQGEPAHHGFGSVLAERSATLQLGGSFTRQWLPEGLAVQVTAPLDRLAT